MSFYGDELTAVQASDGRVYVSIGHLGDALGLTQRGKVQRIQGNEILVEGYQGAIKLEVKRLIGEYPHPNPPP